MCPTLGGNVLIRNHSYFERKVPVCCIDSGFLLAGRLKLSLTVMALETKLRKLHTYISGLFFSGLHCLRSSNCLLFYNQQTQYSFLICTTLQLCSTLKIFSNDNMNPLAKTSYASLAKSAPKATRKMAAAANRRSLLTITSKPKQQSQSGGSSYADSYWEKFFHDLHEDMNLV